MGWGDEIMVTAQARAMQQADPRQVLVIDARARPRWSPIWQGNPRIVNPEDIKGPRTAYQMLLNGPGARPYIAQKLPTRWVWREDWRCEPGELYLTRAELLAAERWRGRVLIEPNIKAKPEAGNKAWLWSRWQELAGRRPAALVQVGPPGTRLLPGVEHAVTADFRSACAVLSVCRAYCGVEGGLHHAAAALGLPGVVLFGGFISPQVTGYALHRNLYRGGVPCGARLPCEHCSRAMAAITVDEVAGALAQALAR